MSSGIVCPKCNSIYSTKFSSKSNENKIYRGKCSNCNTMLRFKIIQDENDKYLKESNNISFKVNGEVQNIGSQYPPSMSLNAYIRNVMNLKGTKIVCREGGCGSCVVNGKVFDPSTGMFQNVSINSCLFPVFAADQWEFTTVEGIGNKSIGLHPIQTRLADYNGSQCGYCSPGMVMNMYNLLLNNPKPTKNIIENSFDGHICRCTGYRSILDAMKSFSADEKPIDIEDLNKLKCIDTKISCINNNKKKVHIISEEDSTEWFIPKTLSELYDLLNEYQNENYRIISGNTSTGVYKNDGEFSVYINIKSIPDLYEIDYDSFNNTLKIGSSISLNKLIDVFTMASSSIQGFEYLSVISTHLSKVASSSIRNIASWAGNLMLKYNHNEFPSDVFVIFETIGAILTINNNDQTTFQATPADFLKIDMKGKFISSILIPSYDAKTTFIHTYKVMPRSQNAHAYVVGGFRFNIDKDSYTVISSPSIVYGGVNGQFIHATQTERYLYGKSLKDESAVFKAYDILNSELNPNYDPVLSSPQYRKSLSISLFYKFILTVCNDIIDNRYKSAIESIIDSRPLSQGQQSFPTTPDLYPLTKPMTKLNAYAQTSGEAAYVYDMDDLPHQLFGSFILTTVGNCTIDKIDLKEAYSMPGVVRILLANDIPGANNFAPSPSVPEPLFCEDTVLYAGQAVGLVIGETFQQAVNAAKVAKISYKNRQKPLLTIFDAIEAKSFHPKPCDDFSFGNADQAIAKAPHSIKGNCSLGSQFHFYMEGQVAVCKPVEDGFEIHSSTQWLDYVLKSAAQVLGLKNSSSISVKTKQLGGAYGGKITRPNMVASAAALAASIVNKPVRVSLELNECMEMVGKRFPWFAEYQIGFDDDGKLLGIKIDYYSDAGCKPNDQSMPTMYDFSDNAYNCPNWYLTATLVKTNTAANTACRSPGTFPCISIMEYIMEHVAKYLKKDVLLVRTLNLYKKGQVTPHGQPLPYFNVDEIITNLSASSDYDKRCQDIIDYNKSNRWKKRGISMVPIKWGASWSGACYNSFVAIYNGDGSVAISHGGIESGQGINTKVAQVCAYELGIPLELISVRKPDNLVEANSITTGGSITSELVCQAIIQCCKQLNQTLDPIRKTMPPNYTWQDLITKAYGIGTDLCARYWIFPTTQTPLAYNVYGAAVSEAIIDVLTGETQIIRTDILYDCGQTINGEIDIGQAEGGFVMGLGFWLLEKLSFDPDSGKCLSNGTWEYKPPTSKDIPQDFRITFLNNNPNPLGVLGSKCVGEPPLCLSLSAMFAVKRAIEAARSEINSDRFFVLNAPATVEYVQRECLIDNSQLKYHD